MLSEKDSKLLQLGVDTLQSIRAQLEDIQVRLDTLFHMTEKHQKEVRDLLKGIQSRGS